MEELNEKDEILLEELRNLDELINKPVYLTDNELKAYILGILILREISNNRKSDNKVLNKISTVLSTPKFIEALALIIVLTVKNIPIKRLV